jgi:cell division protein FtsL
MSVGAVVLLVLTVFCVAAMQAYAAQEGFRVASLERQVRQQEEQTTLLQARQAQLATPERLAEAAQRLGLVADSSTTFLHAPAPVHSDPVQLDALRKLLASGPP